MIKKIFLAGIFISFSFYIRAQKGNDEYNKEVEVITDYQPNVPDANKLNVLPEIIDTSVIMPTLSYSIKPKQITVNFETEPLKPAKMVGEPLNALTGKYIKIGMGSYLSPLFEAYINNLRSKDYSIGAYFTHNSSGGKIKLMNDDKVFAGWFNDELSLYGKKFLENSFFSSNIKVLGSGYHYFGYNPAIQDTVLDKDSIKQQFFGIDYNSKIKSNHIDSTHINYDLNFDYKYFTDKFENFQNSFIFSGKVNKFHQGEMFGADYNLGYYDNSSHLDSSNLFVFKVTPWLGKYGKRWQVRAGIKIAVINDGIKTFMNYYPVCLLQYNIIDNYLVPYIGTDGDYKVNNLSGIASYNPYYNPVLNIKQTNKKFVIFGGFRGNISSITSFNVRTSYSVIDTFPLFVNTPSDLGNTFDIQYANLEMINVFGEFETKISNVFSIGIKGNYYKYTIFDEGISAYHMPDYDFTLNAEYFWRNKLRTGCGLYVLGPRLVKISAIENKRLETALDLNFKAEYYYSKKLSVFFEMNNILGTKYYIWNYYPAQRYKVTAGITYAF